MADETYKGEFYCVKCKEKREAEGKVVVSENGRRHGQGRVPRVRHQPQPHPRQGLSPSSVERPRSHCGPGPFAVPGLWTTAARRRSTRRMAASARGRGRSRVGGRWTRASSSTAGARSPTSSRPAARCGVRVRGGRHAADGAELALAAVAGRTPPAVVVVAEGRTPGGRARRGRRAASPTCPWSSVTAGVVVGPLVAARAARRACAAPRPAWAPAGSRRRTLRPAPRPRRRGGHRDRPRRPARRRLPGRDLDRDRPRRGRRDAPPVEAAAGLRVRAGENGRVTDIPRSSLARTAKLVGLPLGHAGRAALGVGKRVGGRPAEAVAAELQARTAEQLFAVLGQLKGGAMKFGQALSVMEAAMPEELAGPYRATLTKLQESGPPMGADRVHEILARELGPRWASTKLVEFDDLPAAAASIGQVHRASGATGARSPSRSSTPARPRRCSPTSTSSPGSPAWPARGSPASTSSRSWTSSRRG